jgi:hypothetical protein
MKALGSPRYVSLPVPVARAYMILVYSHLFRERVVWHYGAKGGATVGTTVLLV